VERVSGDLSKYGGKKADISFHAVLAIIDIERQAGAVWTLLPFISLRNKTVEVKI